MKKLFAILFFALAPALHVAADTTPPTVSITATGGGQTAQQGTYFASAITATVTAGGIPVRNTQVEFIDSTGTVMFANQDDVTGHTFAFTDDRGTAVAQGAMGFSAGTTMLLIRSVGNDASAVTIPLSVIPGGPTRFEMVSGSHQNATVGTTYAQPWIAQAFDASGSVVPNAAVLFFAPADPTVASVTFDGANQAWARADANGIAISPYPKANLVSGHEEGLAMTRVPGTAQFAIFTYNNMAAGGGSGDGCGAQRKGNGNCGNGNGANHGK